MEEADTQHTCAFGRRLGGCGGGFLEVGVQSVLGGQSDSRVIAQIGAEEVFQSLLNTQPSLNLYRDRKNIHKTYGIVMNIGILKPMTTNIIDLFRAN